MCLQELGVVVSGSKLPSTLFLGVITLPRSQGARERCSRMLRCWEHSQLPAHQPPCWRKHNFFPKHVRMDKAQWWEKMLREGSKEVQFGGTSYKNATLSWAGFLHFCHKSQPWPHVLWGPVNLTAPWRALSHPILGLISWKGNIFSPVCLCWFTC